VLCKCCFELGFKLSVKTGSETFGAPASLATGSDGVRCNGVVREQTWASLSGASTVLISNAYAQGTAAAGGGDMLTMMLFPIIIIAFFFIMTRQQSKRAKEQKALIDGLQKGDEVVVAGLLGKVAKVGDTFIDLEVAKDTVVQVQKQAVTTVLPKGTMR
jgi:preprotein translocase subunit YajC